MVGEKVLHRSLWDFIHDESTRQLYSHILSIARTGRILHFNFNCDSPGKIRLMEMTVSAQQEDGVQFQTRTLQVQERTEQKILDRNASRTDELIHICSWCKAIDTGNQTWKDLDDSISTLELFKRNKLPALTHGICGTCHEKISNKINYN